jgi:hypothetical protein
LEEFGLDFEIVVGYNKCGSEACQEDFIHFN